MKPMMPLSSTLIVLERTINTSTAYAQVLKAHSQDVHTWETRSGEIDKAPVELHILLREILGPCPTVTSNSAEHHVAPVREFREIIDGMVNQLSTCPAWAPRGRLINALWESTEMPEDLDKLILTCREDYVARAAATETYARILRYSEECAHHLPVSLKNVSDFDGLVTYEMYDNAVQRTARAARDQGMTSLADTLGACNSLPQPGVHPVGTPDGTTKTLVTRLLGISGKEAYPDWAGVRDYLQGE